MSRVGGERGVDRAASANLRRLVPRVWDVSADSPLRVTLGPTPEGHRLVEEYAVVPRAGSARWLLPVGAHRATVASMWRYLAMKRLSLKVTRAALAGGFATGVGYRVFPDRLSVTIDARVPVADQAHWLLLSHLHDVLGRSAVHAAIEVRRANPNAKPTLQLFDPTGTAVGYARIGWSPGTRQLVRAESAALEAVHSRLSRLVTPRLLAAGEWRDREFSVASALPEPMRRWTGAPEEFPEILSDIVATGPVVPGTLDGSGYQRGLREELAAAASDEPEATGVLLSWLDALSDNVAPLRFGRWHGDWCPWNHAQHGGRVVAWDWEHSAPEVPVGFDLLHWHFQQVVPVSGLDAAVAAVRRSAPHLETLGVPPESRELVAALYLLEMFARVTRMAVGGGGWNTRFHPRMLAIAAEWTARRPDRAVVDEAR